MLKFYINEKFKNGMGLKGLLNRHLKRRVRKRTYYILATRLRLCPALLFCFPESVSLPQPSSSAFAFQPADLRPYPDSSLLPLPRSEETNRVRLRSQPGSLSGARRAEMLTSAETVYGKAKLQRET